MGLTTEQWAILEAPVPASEIKSYPGKGGKEMRYTSVEFVEGRLSEVDPNYSKEIFLGPKGITVHYTLLGVRRGGAFDYDEEGKYGTPVTNGEARAARRAGKNFLVAKELWANEVVTEDAEEEEEVVARPRKQVSKAQQSNGGGENYKSPTEGQLKYLVEGLKVPPSTAKALNGWGTKNADGTYQPSEVSNVIEALKRGRGNDPEAYDANPTKFISAALKRLAPALKLNVTPIPARRRDPEFDPFEDYDLD